MSSKIIYSSEYGKMCPKCDKPLAKCLCLQIKKGFKDDGIVRVRTETKGRKGKGVTIITGIPFEHDKLLEFAKKIKQTIGTGGTVKSGVIEIQGEHKERLIEKLKKQGFTVKVSGG
ncbi:MAG: translation initiation factor Sui1 [Candidatus Omnitrophica bacterium]|nr:translation initiation factor Sui1 [Candidatus Omnitrophota bacterium]MCK5392899.1 translation initiation factor Sui1 [Candidatus Omnitrophota bacterium]